MKVFVSWSGELSKQIAQILKIWLPRLIQSLDVFYSPDDIEKGGKYHRNYRLVITELSV